MDATTPIDSPGVTEITSSPKGLVARLPQSARTATHFLRSFGFHLMAALLGIALAFL
jgi:hypothetical protein